jgi:hypothetical protein
MRDAEFWRDAWRLPDERCATMRELLRGGASGGDERQSLPIDGQ